MSCQKCVIDPGFHSFNKIGQVNTSTIFYTAPAKAKDNNKDGSKFDNMKIHIQKDTQNKPWIWVVDCGNMKMTHYTEMNFNIQLMNLLTGEPTLQELWVLRPNMWIKTTASVLKKLNKTNVFNKVRYFEGSNIEIFNALQKCGLELSTLQYLIEQ